MASNGTEAMLHFGSLKRPVPLLGELLSALFCDIASGRPHPFVESLKKDFQKIFARVSSEGLGFCTHTLPTLEKAILRSLETKRLETPTAFSRLQGTALPKFLSGLLKDVYYDDGQLRDNVCIASLSEALQVCGLCYKLESPYDSRKGGNGEQLYHPKKVKKVLNNFVEVESELSTQILPEDGESQVLERARSIVSKVMRYFDLDAITPRHSSGSVATGEVGHRKWTFKRIFTKADEVFHHSDYYFASVRHLYDTGDCWEERLTPLFQKMEESITKVVLVPKDSRGPRIISMEPLEIQYLQQGVWREMQKCIERSPLTMGRVNFRSQEINRDLAMQASIDHSYATLDMKEASDRVSFGLVQRLFGGSKEALQALSATRSDGAMLPDGSVVKFHKFAPMGSATCFPVESLVHYALAVAIINHRHKIPIGKIVGRRKSNRRSLVYVFGDDLVIDTRYCASVVEDFPKFGLKLNLDKSFIQGDFRESCGINAYKGVDVSITRWRTPWPSRRLTAEEVSSFCALASLFYQRGYVHVSNTIWKRVEDLLGQKLPTVPIRSRLVHRWHEPSQANVAMERQDVYAASYLAKVARFPLLHTAYRARNYKPRKKEHHQNLEHKAWVTEPIKETEPELCPWSRLLQYLTMGFGAVPVVPRSTLKSRWVAL